MVNKFGCSNSHKDGVSLFKFPSNKTLRYKWIQQVRRTRDKWTPSVHSVLCSNHFTPDCFESSPSAYGITKRVSIKAAAIPTIFKRVLTHEEAIPGKKKRIASEKLSQSRVSISIVIIIMISILYEDGM